MQMWGASIQASATNGHSYPINTFFEVKAAEYRSSYGIRELKFFI